MWSDSEIHMNELLKFVVGYINFYDSELKLEQVEAINEMEAVRAHSACVGMFDDEYASLAEMKGFAYDNDQMVSVIQLA
jgi:hypothetical protein